MVLLVLDTSVVLKWFKEEIHTEIALKIKEEFINGVHEIVEPDLILYEIANAMRYSKLFNQTLIKESLSNLIDMEMDIVIPTQEILLRAVNLSYSYEISLYDAVYIALAELINATMITADEKLYEKIKELKFVKSIVDFK